MIFATLVLDGARRYAPILAGMPPGTLLPRQAGTPAAKDIAKDEVKALYGWVRRKVTGLIGQIARRYAKRAMTDRGEVERFNEMRPKNLHIRLASRRDR